MSAGRLLPPHAPRLPSPGKEYSQDMIDQFENALRLYFTQVDSTIQNILTSSVFLTLMEDAVVGLPTTNPGPGKLWNDAGHLAIGT
jgi:hypothetical protein